MSARISEAFRSRKHVIRTSTAGLVTALVAAAIAAPASAAVSSYWRFDADGKTAGNNPTGAAGEIVDSTGNSHSGTFQGTLANSSWSSNVPGSLISDPLNGTTFSNSLSFSFGNTSRLEAALSSTLPTASSTNNFTFEAFFRTPTTTGTRQIFEQRSDVSPGPGPELLVGSSNELSTRLTNNSGTQSSLNSAANLLGGGAWHHVAVVWDGSTYKGYVDYVQQVNQTSPVTPWTSTGTLTVGQFNSFVNTNGLNSGTMDEIRITNQALAPKQFLRTVTGPSMYYTFDEKANATLPTGASGEVNDSSGLAHHGTFVGTNANSNWSNNVPGPLVYDPLTATTRANTTSFHFGANSAINVLASTTLPTASSDNLFTFETFVQLTNSVGNTGQIFEHRANGNGSGPDIYLANQNDFGLRTTENAAGGGEQENLSFGSANLGDGIWHHLAVVWNGTTLTGYKDYVQIVQITPPAGKLPWTDALTTGEMTIGKYINGATNVNDFIGFMDEVRVTPAALAPSQFLHILVPEPSALAILSVSGSLLLRRNSKRRR